MIGQQWQQLEKWHRVSYIIYTPMVAVVGW